LDDLDALSLTAVIALLTTYLPALQFSKQLQHKVLLLLLTPSPLYNISATIRTNSLGNLRTITCWNRV
jgi:hypothetical protein